MTRELAYANHQMDFMRATDTRSMSTAVMNKGLLSITHVNVPYDNHGFIEPPLNEDAFQIAYQMRNTSAKFWSDGKEIKNECYPDKHFTFFDYKRSWQADLSSPFECVSFYIPRAIFRSIDELEKHSVETLAIAPGEPILDEVLGGLVSALLPAFAAPEQVSCLFLDQISSAIAIHLAATYGGAPARAAHARALTSAQLRRAISLMEASIGADLSLRALSAECGMTPSRFSKSFKASTGSSPHQWMLKTRIESAQNMIRGGKLSLAEVAMLCGFSSQSHLNRTFFKAVGVSPGLWRRTFRD